MAIINQCKHQHHSLAPEAWFLALLPAFVSHPDLWVQDSDGIHIYIEIWTFAIFMCQFYVIPQEYLCGHDLAQPGPQ